MEWQADRAGAALPPAEPEEPFTVLELCWAYFQWAEGYYRKHGKPTRSLDNVKLAIRADQRALRTRAGRHLSASLSSWIQTHLAAKGTTRAYVNKTGRHHQANVQVGSQPRTGPPGGSHGPIGRRGLADGPERREGIDRRGARA